MGSIYLRSHKKADGTTVVSDIWWIKYWSNGRLHRETTESTSQRAARRLLRLREGDVAKGIPVVPRMNRVSVGELLEAVIVDYKVNNKRSLVDAERRIVKHLMPFFQFCRASALTTKDVQRYTAERQAAEATNGSINRELSLLRRAFNLGRQGGTVMHAPHVPMLNEPPPRSGFFERERFEAVCRHLSDDLRAVVRFAYVTGWRVPSEVLPLQWRLVDFEAGCVRLDPGPTKNGDGRLFPFIPELRSLLEAQRERTHQIEREQGRIVPHVFHRDGAPILWFRDTWKNACAAAGCPDRIVHDFRRTAVRNLVRAGIPERVAMQMTGHKTRSVFERYNIVSEGDLREAAEKLSRFMGGGGR